MRHLEWLRIAGVCALLGALVPPLGAGELHPPGAPAPSMKRLDQIDPSVCIESLPHTITAPGRYSLCGSLTAVPGQPGIVVLASDVVIDGGGFVLQGVTGSGDGILVEGEQSNVLVRNLVIREFGGHGIHAPDSSVACSHVSSSSNALSGIVLSHGSLDRCVFSGNGEDGIQGRRVVSDSDGDSIPDLVQISHVVCKGNAGFGISSDHCPKILSDCDVTENGAGGIHASRSAGKSSVQWPYSLLRVRVAGNKGDGVLIRDHYLEMDQCVVDSNQGSGIVAAITDTTCSMGGTLNAVRCRGNAGDGVRLEYDGNVAYTYKLTDSSCRSNGGGGVVVAPLSGSSNGLALFMERCDVSSNTGSGLHMTGGSLVSEACDFSSNGGSGLGFVVNAHTSPMEAYSSVSSSSSRFHGNASHGLHVTTSVDDFSVSVDLSSSSFGSNGQDGCRVESSNSSGSLSLNFTKIQFRSNVGSGLHVVAGPDNDCDGVLRSCVVSSNGSHGVFVDDSLARAGGPWKVEEGTRIEDNTGDGMRYGGGGGAGKVSLQDFHFSSNAGHGLHVITGGGDGTDGLPPSSLEVFTQNGRLLDNTGDGLHMATGLGGGAGKVNMQDMHFSRNGGSGADVSCPASVEGCSFTDNLGPGMSAKHTRTSHVTLMKRVVSSGNGGTGISAVCVDGGPTSLELHLSDAVVSNNGGHGVEVDGGSSAEYVSLNFTKIQSLHNEQAGFRVSGGSYVAPCDASFTACDSSSNGGHGFDITSSTGGGGLPGGPLTVTALHGSASGNLENGINIGSASSGGGAGKATFKEFTITSNSGRGFQSNCPTTIEDCDSSYNGLDGILVQGRREFKGHVTLMKRVVSSGNGGNGIVFETKEVDAVLDLHVENTVCSSNGGNGLQLSVREQTAMVALACSGLSANNNELHGVLIAPVAMDKGLRFSARSSSFSRNGETGITVNEEGLESCVVLHSECSSNGTGGMVLVCDSVHLESNTASHNTGSGISVSSSSGGVVRDNSCSSNTERGITISTSHVEYASNRCVSNGVSGIELAGGFGNVLRDNFVSGNADFGIVVSSSENRLYENRAGVQVNPLFQTDPGLVNDVAQPATATIRGGPNIGF